MSEKPTLLILAAGLGSRYGSLKQIDKIGPSGERIIDYSVFDAIRSGFNKIVYVIRKSFEKEFIEVIINSLPSDINVDYVFQEFDSVKTNVVFNSKRIKPWGTGHALLSASKVINEPFVVINADDFYGIESFRIAAGYLNSIDKTSTQYALIGYKLINTLSDYGSVSRGVCKMDNENFIESIVERTEIKKENGKIIFKDVNHSWNELCGSDIISMNMFAFNTNVFRQFEYSFNSFLNSSGNDLSAEFYIPTVVDEILKRRVGRVKVLPSQASWFGLTYREDKKIASKKILDLIDKNKYPSELW